MVAVPISSTGKCILFVTLAEPWLNGRGSSLYAEGPQVGNDLAVGGLPELGEPGVDNIDLDVIQYKVASCVHT